MAKQLEELSKDLASGMSRRTALWRFVTGLGAALLAGVTGKPAHADGIGDVCVDICRGLGLTGSAFGQCVSDCVRGIN